MTRTSSSPVRADRRDALTSLAVAAGAVVAGCAGKSRAATPPPGAQQSQAGRLDPQPGAVAGHTPKPLPFKPASLRNLSERLITSHHENNYSGAVKNLNRVEQELANLTADTPPFIVGALRERELTFRNSKALHEAYFGNLGGDGHRSGAIETALREAWGSTATWEAQFRATALGLGGGSGWVLLGLELETGGLRTSWSGNHTQVLAGAVPLLVLDMYEHSYHLDFGAAHARYVDAFFQNVNWDEVNRRFEGARRAAAALRG